MQYEETLSYLYNKLPLFSRIGDAAIKKDLSNTRKLCEALDNPQRNFHSIHIAGTNGKGSTSNMLAAILQQAGYKTGLYTSPHLLDFRERIRINGTMISQQEVSSFVEEQKDFIETLHPSFFEVTVAMAFHHFSEHKVDIAIIETGLGGRLDSTNVIDPILSIITNISLDHTHMLGNTLSLIASEKAGIIKPDVPVIIGEKEPDTMEVFLHTAAKTGSKIVFAQDEWRVKILEKGEEYLSLLAQYISPENQPDPAISSTRTLRSEMIIDLDLPGTYQEKNLIPVLSAVEQLNNQNYQITEAHLMYALAHVKELTGLMGRWQTLRREPRVVCDTGHNEAGWKEVLSNLQEAKFKRLHMVIGIMKDKDAAALLLILPKNADYYFCCAGFERALPAQELSRLGTKANLQGRAYDSVVQAVESALENADKEDLIFIGGSTFIVAEALTLFV